MNVKMPKIAKIALSVLVAAALLFFSFRGVDWKEFATEIKACRWPFVLLSMCAGATAFAFRGFRWRDILKPIDPGTKASPCIDGIMIGNIANMVIPYSGEFIRCGVVKRHSSKDAATGKPLATYDKVIGTAVLERAWDMLSVVILLAILLVFKWNDFGDFMVTKIFAPMRESLGGGFLALAIGVAALLAGSIWFVLAQRNRYPGCRKITDVMIRLWQGFSSCFKMKRKGLFFFYTAVIWCMYWLQSVLIIAAMPSIQGLNLSDALFIMLVGSFATCMPVPGGFGAYHLIVSSALAMVYGFPQAGVGIIFATLSHESQALTMIITGVSSYIHQSIISGREKPSDSK